MPSLKDILQHDKEKIKVYCEKLGFTNIRVYCDPDTPTLQLLVNETKDKKQYHAALQTILLEDLGYRVGVTVEERVEPLYLGEIRENSAPIDNEALLAGGFGRALNMIEIEAFPLEEKTSTFKKGVRLANELLGKTSPLNAANSNTLFIGKDNKETTTMGGKHSNASQREVDNMHGPRDKKYEAKKPKLNGLVPPVRKPSK